MSLTACASEDTDTVVSKSEESTSYSEEAGDVSSRGAVPDPTQVESSSDVEACDLLTPELALEAAPSMVLSVADADGDGVQASYVCTYSNESGDLVQLDTSEDSNYVSAVREQLSEDDSLEFDDISVGDGGVLISAPLDGIDVAGIAWQHGPTGLFLYPADYMSPEVATAFAEKIDANFP